MEESMFYQICQKNIFLIGINLRLPNAGLNLKLISEALRMTTNLC